MDSLPYLAFNVARVAAVIALIPGFWLIVQGGQRRYHRLWLWFSLSIAILASLCLFAALSSSGSQADGWDALGTVYWSSIAAAELLLCAIVGTAIGKFRTKSLSE